MRRLCPNAVAVVMLGILMLTGCSATHLHRGEDAELATRAAEGYAALDLQSIIDTERGNLDATLAYELAVVDRLVDVILQREWFRLVNSDEPLSKSFMAGSASGPRRANKSCTGGQDAIRGCRACSAGYSG